MRVEDDDAELGEAAAEDAEIMAVDELRSCVAAVQTAAALADVVAYLEPGERVRIVEAAPHWPLRFVTGIVVARADGTLVLDVWPFPLRLPNGAPGLSVLGCEVLS